MTLSPVFRSQDAVRLLADHGVWSRLAGDIKAQAEAVQVLYKDLEGILGPDFRSEPSHTPSDSEATTTKGLHFLQEYLFLILFRSIFQSVGVDGDRLQLYTELNFCIKGTITAADNIFDDQAKTLLPLAENSGSRFISILQLIAFERLLRKVLDRGEAQGIVRAEQRNAIQLGLLDRMAAIGMLEGSEEGGVQEIPAPDEMLESVHRVRGGALFALAFVAPSILEGDEVSRALHAAEIAVAQLGTAFQIVDDLTDFEFDVTRRSHNLLVSQVHHVGSDEERARLRQYWEGETIEETVVGSLFRESAQAVLERAYSEAQASFVGLAELGFWFNPQLSDQVVQAIVGLDGVARIEDLVAVK